jgi:hypothetical protein
LWWLYLHRRLRSRQRGSAKSLETLRERLCYLEADHFLKARLRFYPLSLKTSLATYLEAKPFGFSMGRE